jgi:large subunit ribosomal protein L18Ae
MAKSRAIRDVSIKHFLIVGRHKETKDGQENKVYKMRIFAKDAVHAKSKFWYFLRKMNKVKKANGEILNVSEIFEKDPSTVKTFGIVVNYKSKFGHHTLYKEFRSTSLNGAVSQLYSEMAGRHKAQRESLTIVRTTELKGDIVKTCRRAYIKQIVKPDVKFPILHKRIRAAPKYRTVFQANRPILNA